MKKVESLSNKFQYHKTVSESANIYHNFDFTSYMEMKGGCKYCHKRNTDAHTIVLILLGDAQEKRKITTMTCFRHIH